MVVRARSLAAVLSGLAALPLAAHANSIGVPTQTPTFSCNAGVVSGINWGDTSSFPSAPGVYVDLVPAVQHFGCDSSGNPTGLDITGSYFKVNWGDLVDPNLPASDTEQALLDVVNYKIQIISPTGAAQWKYSTSFDMYIEFVNTDGFIQGKDFVGLKWTSLEGPATDAKFSITDGTLVLDPNIPGSGTLQLTDTPAVPEPATLVLFGSGLLGGVLRRKKKQKA